MGYFVIEGVVVGRSCEYMYSSTFLQSSWWVNVQNRIKHIKQHFQLDGGGPRSSEFFFLVIRVLNRTPHYRIEIDNIFCSNIWFVIDHLHVCLELGTIPNMEIDNDQASFVLAHF